MHGDSGSTDLAGGRVVKGGGEALYEIKGEGALDSLYIFCAVTAGQVKQGTGALLQLEEKEREKERWKEARNPLRL